MEIISRNAVVYPDPKPGATRRLICLGYCGGSTRSFGSWARCLDERSELAIVCYPGRDGRFAEPFAPDWAALAADATDAVSAVIDRPYVLFGHSMGGWMAFDVATRLERAGLRCPDLVVISACNAPDRGVTERDRFISDDRSDDEVIGWMRGSATVPEDVLADPDLAQMAIDLVRADARVRDSYRYDDTGGTRLPVHVLYGAEDVVIDPAAPAAWGGVCHGPFALTVLPGGHFYTPDVWRALPDHFVESIPGRQMPE